ncbi:MAG: tRNA preQ1(34) S-adenosylmethionine ribosyltransferase-isomerase QueA [Mariprofundaceae bacterium]
MQLSDFDYQLPAAMIARRPLAERDAARLLLTGSSVDVLPTNDGFSDAGIDDVCIGDRRIRDAHIRDLVSLVQPGDVWVVNDTRVIPARLFGRKKSGGKVELLLLEPVVRDSKGENNVWLAWGKANKPLKTGDRVHIAEGFCAEILHRDGKQVEIRLVADDVAAAIEAHGHMPLPPYIDRPDSEEDKNRYQTVFAHHAGAVAAPTAGLHLSSELMAAMRMAGAIFVHITLHVGPGTFQPVQVEHIAEHQMHEEAYIVSQQAADQINLARSEGRRVVAVGTTSLRTLEAAGESGKIVAGNARTDLFITPGYNFRMVDALLTNFHLPRSTLLMLVCALAGYAPVMAAYRHAIEAEYRFYSYGDAMFVVRSKAEDERI